MAASSAISMENRFIIIIKRSLIDIAEEPAIRELFNIILAFHSFYLLPMRLLVISCIILTMSLTQSFGHLRCFFVWAEYTNRPICTTIAVFSIGIMELREPQTMSWRSDWMVNSSFWKLGGEPKNIDHAMYSTFLVYLFHSSMKKSLFGFETAFPKFWIHYQVIEVGVVAFVAVVAVLGKALSAR